MTPEAAIAVLRRHVLEPFGAHCIDKEHGGFLVDLDERWRPLGPQEKSLEHAARTALSFARLEKAMPGEGCADLARHGFRFLQQAMWDREHGGFFARVDRSGKPLLDGLKHPHGVTYAAQAFAESAGFLEPGEGESWAARAHAWLDDVTWDRQYGGYWGAYRRDNERYPDWIRLPTQDGRDPLGVSSGFKESNTLGDAIEMLAVLAREGIGNNPADRFNWLIELVADRLIDPHGAMGYLYRRDWRLAPSLVRVGDSFAMAHRLALARCPPELAKRALEASLRLVGFCLAWARHPGGGFCHAVAAQGRSWPDAGQPSDLRQWWVQLEAMHALHVLGHHPSVDSAARARYLQVCEEQWAFLRACYLDESFRGIRSLPLQGSRQAARALLLWPLRKDRQDRYKTHAWKDPYHEVSAFLAIARVA